MGLAMAGNLARAGFAVRAYNRSREKAEGLVQDGAWVLDSAAEAAEGAEVILTILSDADSVISTMQAHDGALQSAAADRIWLQMSTIGEAGTDRAMALAREHELRFVDAPVLGTKQPAEQGKLVVLASGPEELRESVQPIFDVIGQRTMWVGEAGAGTRLKLVSNAWLLAVVEGLAETIALAQGIDVEPRLLLEAVGGGPLDMPYLQLKGQAMIERSFEPSFALRLAAKDASLVQASVDAHGLELPVLSAIGARMQEGAGEHGDKDLSATYLSSVPAGTAA